MDICISHSVKERMLSCRQYTLHDIEEDIIRKLLRCTDASHRSTRSGASLQEKRDDSLAIIQSYDSMHVYSSQSVTRMIPLTEVEDEDSTIYSEEDVFSGLTSLTISTPPTSTTTRSSKRHQKDCLEMVAGQFFDQLQRTAIPARPLERTLSSTERSSSTRQRSVSFARQSQVHILPEISPHDTTDLYYTEQELLECEPFVQIAVAEATVVGVSAYPYEHNARYWYSDEQVFAMMDDYEQDSWFEEFVLERSLQQGSSDDSLCISID